MARRHSGGAKPPKTSKGGNWIFFVLVLIIILLSMGNVDNYVTSTAPVIKRCDACGFESKVWWTVDFTYTRSWDTTLSEMSLSDQYIPSYTLCEACFYKAYHYMQAMG